MFRDKYGCFFFNERFVLQVGVVVAGIPAVFLMYKLIHVNDAFGIKPEVLSCISAVLVAAGEPLRPSPYTVGATILTSPI